MFAVFANIGEQAALDDGRRSGTSGEFASAAPGVDHSPEQLPSTRDRTVVKIEELKLVRPQIDDEIRSGLQRMHRRYGHVVGDAAIDQQVARLVDEWREYARDRAGGADR